MMKRKVIKLAQQTLVVSLPANWCRANNVIKGAEVIVEPIGSDIHIRTTMPRDRVLTATAHHPLLAWRIVSSAYKAGYDELVLRVTPVSKEVILKELEDLTGYELVHDNGDQITIRNIAPLAAHERIVIEQRIWFTILDMAQRLETETKPALEHAERVTDKLSNTCKRILALQAPIDTAFLLSEYAIVRELEQLADVYAKLPTLPAKQLKPLHDALSALHALRMKPSENALLAYHQALPDTVPLSLDYLKEKIKDLAGPVITSYLHKTLLTPTTP